MSIYFSGCRTRSNGVLAAIGKQLKGVNLKGVKRITITFDPFAENVKSTRELLFLLTTPKVQKTNPNCLIKSDIVCNRAPSEVKFSLIESAQELAKVKEVRFVSDNLNTLELLQLCNKHITPLAPVEDLVVKTLTKAEKQKLSSAGKKGQRRK
ncbi:uncharacterized protein LOC119678735 [Teleopsis dalmanni]|uniref:uncharacterized protein LOC119678735 n=1 Tax=Teleopsis dalmanni TaxID=139649 RepID=UPI000D32991C|nr:uncharacterized protein LOC119678735 [Teleopsis dalmanni]